MHPALAYGLAGLALVIAHPAMGAVAGRPKLVFLGSVGNGQHMAKSAAFAFRAMQKAAAKDGVKIIAVSGFRSVPKQAVLYAVYLKELSKYKVGIRNTAPAPVAKPGFSNHNSGLAVDIDLLGGGMTGKVYKWLEANAMRFGFDNEELPLGVEPWHWRFNRGR